MSAAGDAPRVAATYRTRIGWSDTDASGHYHNSTVVRLIEAAEATLVRERGITGWFGVIPRVRQEIDYQGRLWFDQPVACEIVLERLGTSSATFTFEVWGEDFGDHRGGRAASGRMVVVHAPDLAGRAEPWPAAWREALGG
ncbi:acyl-CoA thioesterase [Blastococcus sp. SYSU D00820]